MKNIGFILALFELKRQILMRFIKDIVYNPQLNLITC